MCVHLQLCAHLRSEVRRKGVVPTYQNEHWRAKNYFTLAHLCVLCAPCCINSTCVSFVYFPPTPTAHETTDYVDRESLVYFGVETFI